MKKGILFLLIAAAIVLVGIIILRPKGEAPKPFESGFNPNESTVKEVPNLTLKDYKGDQVSLSQFKGRPLLINAWAAWCPFCVKELKDFVSVQEELGDKVVIIAVDRAESLETAKGYTDKLGVSEKLIFLLDPRDSFYKAIGGFSMPETIFVDKSGKVVDHKRGPMDKEEIKARIEKIL